VSGLLPQPDIKIDSASDAPASIGKARAKLRSMMSFP